jgi:hypothetical protein
MTISFKLEDFALKTYKVTDSQDQERNHQGNKGSTVVSLARHDFVAATTLFIIKPGHMPEIHIAERNSSWCGGDESKTILELFRRQGCRSDAAAAGLYDSAGDDHWHAADGAFAGKRRRAKRAHRPSRDRRVTVRYRRDFAYRAGVLFAVRVRMCDKRGYRS